MALYSILDYIGTGSSTDYLFNIPYISKSDIHVYVSGTEVTFTWVSSTLIRLDAPPADQAPIQIRRETNKETAKHTFPNPTYIESAGLNTNQTQALYLDQEQDDILEQYPAASESAAAAATSETNAATSETNASNSASSATSSASAAATSETNAASSAAEAADSAASITLKSLVLEIGDWNMDTASFIWVAHGLDSSKIRTLTVLIRQDGGVLAFALPTYNPAGTSVEIVSYNSTQVEISRATNGTFDNTNYDTTSFNRGWVTIQYIE